MVARVASGRSLTAELQRAAEADGFTAQAALTDLCFGTLRGFGHVQAIVGALARRSASETRVDALLWCALYALESRRYAAYTVVDQAVRACVALGHGSAKAYVNALLRAYLRQQRSIEARLAGDPVAHWRHPAWWIERAQVAYADEWRQILAAGNSHPPMCLRVNRRRCTPAAYLERLAAQGIVAKPLGAAALLLESPVPARRLPGFADGEVSIQDAGAQRTPQLLDLRAGQRVLDACAAPGGKCAHILETADVALTALELQVPRAEQLARNLARLGLAAEVRAADCNTPENWWDGRAYERILADVPCSGSGVARRHPDIKWLRRAGDMAAYAARQARILVSLWRVLAPNGKLLYVTCSIFPEENDAVVETFLAATPTARQLPLPDGRPRQLLPSPEHDGYHFALLEKVA